MTKPSIFFCDSVVWPVGSQLPVMFSADRKTIVLPACAKAEENRKSGLIRARPVPMPAAPSPARKLRLLIVIHKLFPSLWFYVAFLLFNDIGQSRAFQWPIFELSH